MAGALSGLRRDWGLGRLGADWAAGDGLLGLVQYSTYRERDYDAIWDRYAWVRPLSIWFERVRLAEFVCGGLRQTQTSEQMRLTECACCCRYACTT